MRLILNLLVVSILAGGLGLGLTALAVRDPPTLDAITTGPWKANASEGTAEIDAYALAGLASRGELPLAIADGLSFRATKDGSGQDLDGRCSYLIAGEVPAVRVWSLAVYDQDGRPFTNAAHRQGFSSADASRDADGAIAIALSSSARPGDWLPIRDNGPFVLLLRLYDTTAGAIAGGRSAPELPAVRRLECRP